MTDPKSLWQHQDVTGAPPTLEQLREHSGRFERKIRTRNMIEYVAAAFVVVIFSLYIVVIPNPMAKLGSVMIIAGTLYAMWQLRRRASPAKPDAAATAATALAFHRGELLRQQKALEGVWRWYLGPMAPGLLVFVLGPSFLNGTQSWSDLWRVLGFSAVFGAVWCLNWLAAKRLRREIERLDALERE